MGTDSFAPPVTAYIGIGSNLRGPEMQVRHAIGELAGIAGCRLRACSALYRTPPVGPPGQPEYVNAAVSLETRLEPNALLDTLQAIERDHGRVRDGAHWGPRVLDLDLLLYGAARIDRPNLRVPHPEISRRAFVLVPLADVAPHDIVIPECASLADLLAACDRAHIVRLDGAPVRCDAIG